MGNDGVLLELIIVNRFNIAQAALDDLTDGQAVQLGRIDAQWVQVDASVCGL